MKKLILVVCLLASQAFAQSFMITPPIKFTAFSSQYYLYLWNSNAATLQEVLNRPCPTGSTLNEPAVYQMDYVSSLGPPLSVFSTDMSKYLYRDSINISGVMVKFCYSIQGYVSKTLVLTPVLHNIITDDVYEPGAGLPPAITPGNYYETSARMHTVFWDYSLFPLSSQALHSGQWEFGVRVRYLNPNPPEIIDSVAVKIHTITMNTWFTTSATITNLGAPQVNYVPNLMTFDQGKLTVNVNWPRASTTQGGRIYILCANGAQVEIGRFGWNTQNLDQYTYTWSINAFNTASKCGGNSNAGNIAAPLTFGSITRIGVAPSGLGGENLGGEVVWSGDILLN